MVDLITLVMMSKSVVISANFLNERVNDMNTFEIKAIILDSSPSDLIIRRYTIKKFDLVYQIPSQFEDMSRVLITKGKTSEHVNKRCGCQPKKDLLPSAQVPKTESCYLTRSTSNIQTRGADSNPDIAHSSVISSRFCFWHVAQLSSWLLWT